MDQKIISKTDLIILCGGQGSRIKEVANDKPKILIELGGRPYLDGLIHKLYVHGFRRIIFCVGYLAEKIVEHIESVKNNYPGLEVVFSIEKSPLGTGGAIKNAEALVKSDPFMAMNGDMIFDLDFNNFYKFHLDKKGLFSMALAEPQEEKDYGVVVIDEKNNRIVDFKEKNTHGGLISAGTYIMSKSILGYMKNLPSSLEYDLFPRIIATNCYGFLTGGRFIDIGTRERYEKAQRLYQSDNPRRLS